METFFKELFEYNHYVNQRLLDVFNEKQGTVSEKAWKLYSHILNAHQIWNNRMEPRHAGFGIWDIHPVQESRYIDNVNHEHTLFIIDRLDLNNTMTYKRQGHTFNKSYRDLLFHIINHSTYHRAQIASEFRQSGLEPLSTDYIFYQG